MPARRGRGRKLRFDVHSVLDVGLHSGVYLLMESRFIDCAGNGKGWAGRYPRFSPHFFSQRRLCADMFLTGRAGRFSRMSFARLGHRSTILSASLEERGLLVFHAWEFPTVILAAFFFSRVVLWCGGEALLDQLLCKFCNDCSSRDTDGPLRKTDSVV